MSTVDDLKLKLAELGGQARLDRCMKDMSLTREQIREGGLHIYKQASNDKWMVSLEAVDGDKVSKGKGKGKGNAKPSAPKAKQQPKQAKPLVQDDGFPKVDSVYVPLPAFDMDALKLKLLEIGGAGRLDRVMKETQFTREALREAGLHIFVLDSNQKWMVSLEPPTLEQRAKTPKGSGKGGKGGKAGKGGKGTKGAGKGGASAAASGGAANMQMDMMQNPMMQMLGGCMQMMMAAGGGAQGVQQMFGGKAAAAAYGKSAAAGGKGKGKKLIVSPPF